MHNFTSIFTPVHAAYDTAMRNAREEHRLFSGDTVYLTTLTWLKDQYELPGADKEIESLAIFHGQGIDKALHHWSDVLAANNAKELL